MIRETITKSYLPDAEGLICAFDLAPLAPRDVDVLDEPAMAAPVWLHLNLNDTRAQRWLEQRSQLPAPALALLLGSDSRIHGQVSGDALIAVLGDLHHDFKGDPENFGVVRVYVDARRMITTRRHPLRSLDLLRHQLGEGDLEALSPFGLFEHLVRALAETFAGEIAQLADETDDIEDIILAGLYHEQGAALGRIRRMLVRLRRHMSGNRAALAAISARLAAPVASEEQQHRLRQAAERLDTVAQDLELVQERARLLQEEIAGRVGEETSRNLFWLSIVTATLLPITLITGVFGMNVGGLPLLEHRSGFWWVMGLIGAAVVAILWFLRKRKVL